MACISQALNFLMKVSHHTAVFLISKSNLWLGKLFQEQLGETFPATCNTAQGRRTFHPRKTREFGSLQQGKKLNMHRLYRGRNAITQCFCSGV